MSKNFIENEELLEIANKVIEEKGMDYLNNVRIKYVLATPNISKTNVAKCIKASDELRYFGGFDFLIEISNDIYEQIDEDMKEIIIYQSLLHICVINKEDGTVQLKLINHTVQNYSQIIKTYGDEWYGNLKTLLSSIHDLKPSDMDSIKI